MGLWNDFYENSIIIEAINKDSGDNVVKKITNIVPLNEIKTIYEQCCGIGRIALAFEQKPIQVFGTDLSLNSIKILKSKSKFPDNFNVYDSTKYVPIIKVDMVINYYSSFGSIPNRLDNMKFIDNALNCLNTNGYFILEIQNIEFIKQNFKKEFLYHNGILRKTTLGDDYIIQEWLVSNKQFITKIHIFSNYEIIEYAKSIGFILVNLEIGERLFFVFK